MADTRTDEIAPPKEVVKAQKDVADLEDQRADIDRQIAEASVLIQAWENFNRTLRGEFKEPAAPAEPKTRKATGPRAQKGTLPKGHTEVLTVIDRYADGAKTEKVMDELKPVDDAEKRRIYAALNKLKNAGSLDQDGPRQPYKITPQGRALLHPETSAKADEAA
jgi:hypothetical protein